MIVCVFNARQKGTYALWVDVFVRVWNHRKQREIQETQTANNEVMDDTFRITDETE